VDDLFKSLRRRGVVEGLQSFTYFAALATSRFDRYSHTLPAHLIGSQCSVYATTTVPGCSANFAGGGATAAPRHARTRRHHRSRARHHRHRAPAAPSAPAAPATPALPALPQVPEIHIPGLPPVHLPEVHKPPLGAKNLLDYLLG
jgi:hypothetical protein